MTEQPAALLGPQVSQASWYDHAEMTYRGKVKGGTVVVETGSELPEGADVLIEIELPGPVDARGQDPLIRMPALAVETEIPDLATNVDHYLYGHPKVDAG